MSPSPPRSGPELQTSASSLITSANGQKSANDSPEQNAARRNGYRTKRIYITRARVERVASRMDGVHWSILRDVGRLGIMTGKQLQRLHHDPSEAGGRLARKKLAQLSGWHVLIRLGRPLLGWGYVYAVGAAGQRLLYPERLRHRPPWAPQPNYLRHALAVSNLYVGLREAERSEAVKLAVFDAEPECWRHYFGPGGARLMLKPDALAVVHLGEFEDRYFCELDCGTEPGPRITAKARAYVRYWQSGREDEAHGIFPYVLWVAATEKRKAFLIDALASLPPEHWQIFMVATAEEAVALIATGTSVPIGNRKEVNS